MSEHNEDEHWRRKCDAFAEVATQAMQQRSTQGFWNAMRWLVVNHCDTYGLHFLAEFLTSECRRCVPDGWAVGVHEGQLIVAVFEQDDTHYDPPKWHELAWVFDSCDNAWLVEVRRRYNGPLLLRIEGTMCTDELDKAYTPVIMQPQPWSTATPIDGFTKTTSAKLDAWMRTWEANGSDEDYMCDTVHLDGM